MFRSIGVVAFGATASAVAWFALSAVTLTSTMLLPLPLLIAVGATDPARWGRAASSLLTITEVALALAALLGAGAPAAAVSYLVCREVVSPLTVLAASIPIVSALLWALFRADAGSIILVLVTPVTIGYVAGYLLSRSGPRLYREGD